MPDKTTLITDFLDTLYPNRSFDTTNAKSLHKHHLEYLTERLNSTVPDDATVSEYRSAIRTQTLDNDAKTTPFGKTELRNLSRAIRDKNHLDAPTVLPALKTRLIETDINTVKINGTEYSIAGHDYKQDGCSAPGYDGYLLIHLNDDYRLAAFINWDSDGCTYHTSLALEQRKGYDPYVKWKKETYVHTLEFPDTDIDTIKSYPDPDQVKTQQTLGV